MPPDAGQPELNNAVGRIIRIWRPKCYVARGRSYDMTETKALETTIRSFLLGLSVGMLVAIFMKPRTHSTPSNPVQDIVDLASEDSFPASDAPAY